MLNEDIRAMVGLNEDIRAMVGMLDIKELVVLSQRAQKMEVTWKEKRKQRPRRGPQANEVILEAFRLLH